MKILSKENNTSKVEDTDVYDPRSTSDFQTGLVKSALTLLAVLVFVFAMLLVIIAT